MLNKRVVLKSFIALSAIFAMLLALFAGPNQASAAVPNLIGNPSVEVAVNNQPTGWNNNSWGSNTAQHDYLPNGDNSDHSLKITVTNYVDGDAKSYPDPVSVNPGANYVFSGRYKANVKTHVVAMALDAAGNASYQDVAINVGVSGTTWKTVSGLVHTPLGTTHLTILHVIEANGWLQIDNFDLHAATAIVTTDNVPNGSVEMPSEVDPNVPAGWFKSSWGTNTPRFEYLATGHDSARSVKLTMTKYTDGDAKWTFTPQPLQAGASYQIKFWYQTNASPHVVTHSLRADGTEKFFGNQNPQPSGTGWQLYTDVFTVPADAVSTNIYVLLSGNGWLTTDDFAITPYTYVGFARPLVSLTFDDGFEVNDSTVRPRLDAYGYQSTQCFATQFVKGNPTAIASVQAFANSGHEICSHTVTHPFLTKVTATKLDRELKQSQLYLQSIIGKPVTDFASPYGDYNAKVNTAIGKYYAAHRTVDEGFNSRDRLDPMRLRVQNLKPTTTLAEFQGWLAQAKATNTWLILVYHKVDDTGLEAFDTYTSDFVQQLAAIQASGMTVKTMHDALTEVTAQLPV